MLMIESLVTFTSTELKQEVCKCMVQGTKAGVIMVHVLESLQDCDHNLSELRLKIVTFIARYANTAQLIVYS